VFHDNQIIPIKGTFIMKGNLKVKWNAIKAFITGSLFFPEKEALIPVDTEIKVIIPNDVIIKIQ
jgi:hypothetical protein